MWNLWAPASIATLLSAWSCRCVSTEGTDHSSCTHLECEASRTLQASQDLFSSHATFTKLEVNNSDLFFNAIHRVCVKNLGNKLPCSFVKLIWCTAPFLTLPQGTGHHSGLEANHRTSWLEPHLAFFFGLLWICLILNATHQTAV